MAVAVVGVMRVVVVASVRGWGRGHVAVTRYYGLGKLCVISVFFSSDKKEGLVFKNARRKTVLIKRLLRLQKVMPDDGNRVNARFKKETVVYAFSYHLVSGCPL